MKVGDLVKLRDDAFNCIEEISENSRGIIVHSEEVDQNECDDETCKYLVYVKWAGIENGFIHGRYWIYHDIDLDVVQAA